MSETQGSGRREEAHERLGQPVEAVECFCPTITPPLSCNDGMHDVHGLKVCRACCSRPERPPAPSWRPHAVRLHNRRASALCSRVIGLLGTAAASSSPCRAAEFKTPANSAVQPGSPWRSAAVAGSHG